MHLFYNPQASSLLVGSSAFAGVVGATKGNFFGIDPSISFLHYMQHDAVSSFFYEKLFKLLKLRQIYTFYAFPHVSDDLVFLVNKPSGQVQLPSMYVDIHIF